MPETRVFVSYSHLDARWVRDLPSGPEEPEDLPKYPYFLPWLARHLAQSDVVFWYDQALRGEPGEAFWPKIRSEIEQADMIVLLISENFVGSAFIRDFELPEIRARVEAGQASLVPILVGPTDWDNLGELEWLLPLQIIPGRPTPLVEYISDVAAYEQVRVDILSSIRNRLRKLREAGPQARARADAATDQEPPAAPAEADDEPSAAPFGPAPSDAPVDRAEAQPAARGVEADRGEASRPAVRQPSAPPPAGREAAKLERLHDELRRRLRGESGGEALPVIRAILALDPLDPAALDARAAVADTMGGEVLRLAGHTRPLRCVAFSPDGAQACSGDSSGEVRLWDLYTGLETRRLSAGPDAIAAMEWLADGDRLVTGSAPSGLVALWDIATGEQIARTECGPAARLAVSPDGTLALTVAAGEQVIRVWDVESGEVVDELLGSPAEVLCVAIAPDGAHALSGDRDGWVRMWDLALGIELWTSDLALRGTSRADPCGLVAFSRDGQHWAATAGTLVHWGTDIANPAGASTGRGIGRTILGLACSPSGDALVTSTDAGTIGFVRESLSSRQSDYQPHRTPVRAVAISPTDRRALSGDDEGRVIYWAI